ncbi:hypothetical protein ACG2OD_37030 [Streptomyces sp. PDY-4]|uniref:hypothetical protein n=1 Tax=Streptomyces TaxID=1883 RepID=UPI00331E444E
MDRCAGLDTSGHRWQAWLNLDNAAALLVEEPEDVDDVSLWVIPRGSKRPSDTCAHSQPGSRTRMLLDWHEAAR